MEKSFPVLSYSHPQHPTLNYCTTYILIKLFKKIKSIKKNIVDYIVFFCRRNNNKNYVFTVDMKVLFREMTEVHFKLMNISYTVRL